MSTSDHHDPRRIGAVLAWIAIIAIGASLATRTVAALGGGAPWLVWPLAAAEVIALGRLALLVPVTSGRRSGARGMDVDPPAVDAGDVSICVAVLATPGTTEEHLRTAVLGARQVEGAAGVLVVDATDGHGLAALAAASFGVRAVVAGPTFDEAVAVAVSCATTTHVALIGAHAAAGPDLVRHSRDALRGARDAWVQSTTVAAEDRSVVQHLHHEVVARTTDEWGTTPWTGHGSVVSVEAFRSVPLDGGAFDVTARILQAGWYGRSTTALLAVDQRARSLAQLGRGRAVHAADRLRVLRTRRSPLWARSLPVRSRLTLVGALMEDVAAVAAAVVALTVAAALATGDVPIAGGWALAALALAGYGLAVPARSLLTGGILHPGSLAHANADRVGSALAGALGALVPRRSVAAPRAAAGDREGLGAALSRSATLTLAIVLEVALAGRALSALTGRGFPDADKVTDVLLLAVGAAVLLPFLASLRLVVSARQLRVSRRAPVSVPAVVEGRRAVAVDLGSNGVGLDVEAPIAIGSSVTATLYPAGRAPVAVRAVVVRSRPTRTGAFIGLQLDPTTPRVPADAFTGLWIASTARAPEAAPRYRRSSPGILPFRVGGSSVMRVATAFTLLAVGAANLPPYTTSSAAPAPGVFSVSKSAPATQLYGTDGTNTIQACNTVGSPRYNLSVRDVLPVGTAYVSGSATPAPLQVIANQPSTGKTTLIWSNVSDLQTGSCFTISYRVDHNRTGNDSDTLHVGDSFTNTATGYVQADPRYVPRFTATGTVVAGSFTNEASASATTAIVPIVVVKDEPSPEDELVRGIHDHSTVYTLTVTNNSIRATNTVSVEDWLPAGIEFLGCGTVDNTPDGAVEYPGAPRLDVSTPDLTSDCPAPALVETVEVDPDGPGGPLRNGVHTHIRWELGNLAVGATRTITYRAGVPNRENVLFAEPVPATDGKQGANLSNNAGAPTTEPVEEKTYTNLAAVTGAYTGVVSGGGAATRRWATDTETVSSEDFAVQKSACNQTPPDPRDPATGPCLNGVTYEGTTTWTLRIATSEYRETGGIVVTDVLGDGLEYRAGTAEITAGADAVAPFEPETSIGADGTQRLVWDFDELLTASSIDPIIRTSSVYVISFDSRTLPAFRRTGKPVLSFDTLVNDVVQNGTSAVVRGDDTSGPVEVADRSGASITSRWSMIDKRVLSGAGATGAPGALGCSVGHLPASPDVTPRFAPNEIACFELTTVFPAGIRVRDALVTDFIPPNSSYVGYATYADHSTGFERLVTGAVGSSAPVAWAFGVDPTATPRFTSSVGDVFHVVVAVRVVDDPAANNNYDLVQNLLKVTGLATDGSSVSLRDMDVYRVAEPELALVKGVVDIVRDGAHVSGYPKPAPAGGTDNHTVVHGDVVTYRIDVPNVGPQFPGPDAPAPGALANPHVDGSGRQVADAINVTVWDVLPAALSCDRLSPADITSNVRASVVASSAAALPLAAPFTPTLTNLACDSTKNRMSFVVDRIPAGHTLRVTYTMEIPTVAAANAAFQNTAGVRDYNDVGGGTTYYPSSNIDSSVTSNSPAAKDAAQVKLPSATVAKSAATAITESNNNAASQATIGERITYTVSVTVPGRTTVYDALVSDPLPSGVTYTAGSVRVTASPLSPPAFGLADEPTGFDLSETATGWQLAFPTGAEGYRNATAKNHVFTITYDAVVKDITANVHGTALRNTAALKWNASAAGSKVGDTSSAATVTVVEPKPVITKSHTPAGTVLGGTVLTYSVKVENSSGRSPLHDVIVTDCVPEELRSITPTAPTAPSSVVVGSVGSCAGNGTLVTWTLVALEPKGLEAGSPTTLAYTAAVIAEPVADDDYVNTAKVTGSSLGGTVTGERTTYAATTTDTVRVAKPSITKTVSPGVLTIGQQAAYTLKIAIPPTTSVPDAVVTDLLGTNLVFDAYGPFSAANYGPGCAVEGVAGHIVPRNGQQIGWFLGDLQAAPDSSCEITLTYTAHVGTGASSGDVLPNTARLGWNMVSRVDDVTALPPAAVDRTVEATASVKVAEPKLTIDKTVDDADRIVDGGQLLTYTLTISNNGTWPAFDVTIDDVVPEGLLGPTTLGGTCPAATDGTYGDGTLRWSLFTGATGLAAGTSCTLTYRQQVAPATESTDGAVLPNTATIRTWYGDPDRERPEPDDFRTYGPVSDRESVTVLTPTLSLQKTVGDGSELGQATIGSPFTWKLVVRNTSATRPPNARVAFGVDLADTLPNHWSYTATTSITPAKCNSVPTTAVSGDRQTLTWTDMCDLAPGETITVVFTATPQPSAAVDPGLVDGDGRKVDHVNSARMTASDRGGSPLTPLQDTAVAQLRSVDLSILKTDASDDGDGSPESPGFVVGSTGTYSLDVRNGGPDVEPGPITVVDTLPAGLEFRSASGSGWTCAAAAPGFRCTHPGPLAANANLPQLAVVVDVGVEALNDADGDADASTGLVVNSATVDGTATDRDPSNDSDDEPTPVARRSDFAIDKTLADDTPFVPGTTVRYVLSVTNLGPSPASGPVPVVDELPAGLRLDAVSGEGWDCTVSVPGSGFTADPDVNGRVDCARVEDELPSGERLPAIIAEVSIDPAVTTTIVNVARVTHPNDHNPENDTNDERANPAPEATLTISKRDGDATFRVGQDDATYTIVVSNIGPSVEQGPVVVDDELPAGLDLGSVTGDGWECVTEGRAFSCTWIGDGDGADPVAPYVTLPQITIVSTVLPSAAPDPRPGADNEVVNRATVRGTTDDEERDDDESTPVLPVAELAIDKTHDESSAPWRIGEVQQFTIAVTNLGPSPEYGPVTVTDPLPAGLALSDASGIGWICTLLDGPGDGPNGTVSCTYERPDELDEDEALLPVGDALPEIVVEVEIGPDAAPAFAPETNTIVNVATVVGTTDGDPHEDTDEVPVVPLADLLVDKVHHGDVFEVGASAGYTITVLNNGPSVAAGPIVVTDELPVGLTFTGADGAGWDCSATGQLVTCTHEGSLAVESIAVVDLTVAVGAAAYDPDRDLENVARVDGPTEDPVPENDEDDAVVPVAPAVDLTIDKRHVGTAEVGELLTFELVVTNLGPNDHEDGTITVVDELPEGLTFVSAAGDGWTCGSSGSTVTCTITGPLAVDASLAPIVIEVGVGTAAELGLVNRATVSTEERDVDGTNDSDTDEVVAAPVANLSVVKQRLSDLVVGKQATWRIVVTNEGPSAAADVQVIDQVPVGMTPVSATPTTGTCVIAGPRVTCAQPSLAATATISVDLVVDVVAQPADGTGEFVNTVDVSTSTRESLMDDNRASAGGPVTEVGVSSGGGGSGSDTSSGGLSLPATGTAVVGMLAAGSTFLLAGILLLGTRRRRPAP